MHAFRHRHLQRLVALALCAGVLSGAAGTVQARPAERYAGWLREQATREAKALVDAALRRLVLPPEATPAEFLTGYADAQQRLAARPTGALFGYDDLTFLQAIGRLETRLAGFAAPTPDEAFEVAPVPAPLAPHAPPLLLVVRAPRVRLATAPVGAPVSVPEGLPLRLLHGVSAAQPMGP